MLGEKELQDIANILRRDVLKMTSAAGSGHPTSCLSCAEIMSVLFFNEMHYDAKNPLNPDNDEFILSKGHAAPILYSSLFRAGCTDEDLSKLRKLKSDLEGHPIPSDSLPWIKVATGSLGQGMSIGVGMALAAKFQKRKFRVYVLIGDSESSEGSVYEALQLASYYQLDNLCAIIDVNRLGQRGETMLGHDLRSYMLRFNSFGWRNEIVDGHEIKQIINAFGNARRNGKPTFIIAKTKKGKGVSFLEDAQGWHGKVLNERELKKALKEIPNVKMPKFQIAIPEKIIYKREVKNLKQDKYETGEDIATREAYGMTLAHLAEANSNVIIVDTEVSNSTKSEEVKKTRPEQFIEGFIAEQNMIGMCLGLSKKGFSVFGSSFAAFLSRAHDQIRMCALSKGSFTLCGSHAGVSIGEDGASQMGLEDIAIFRSLPSSIIFYPCDAVSCQKIVKLCLKSRGIKYIRTTRAKTKVIYDKKEDFKIGEFKVLENSKNDRIVLIGAGITLHEALKAYKLLKKDKITSAIIDLYCIKPLNEKKILQFVKQHGNKIIVAEDHYPEGGIGEMLSGIFANTDVKIKRLAVKEIPHSGTKEELLRKYEIDAEAIANAARELIKNYREF